MQLANPSFRVPPFNGRDLDLELVDPGSVGATGISCTD